MTTPTLTVDIPTGDGQSTRKYTLHTFSPLDGRSIVAGYPLSLLNKDFTYKNNEEAMLRLMCYVSVQPAVGGISDVDADPVHLVNRELINEHIPDWWTLVQLEYECLRFNCTFLANIGMLDAVKSGITAQLKVLVADHLDRVGK